MKCGLFKISKGYQLRLLSLLLVLFGVFGLGLQNANATVLYSQTNISTPCVGAGYGCVSSSLNTRGNRSHQELGTGLIGTVASFSFSMSVSSGLAAASISATLACYDTVSTTTINYGCSSSNVSIGSLNNVAKTTYTAVLSPALVLNPNKWYGIHVNCTSACSGGTNPNEFLYGSNFNSYENPTKDYFSFSGATSSTDVMQDMGFSLSTLTESPLSFSGCMDNMAINYNPNANVENGSCYYTIATSTHITDLYLDATSSPLTYTFGYQVASADLPALIYIEEKNDRDGVYRSGYSTTTGGITYPTHYLIPIPLSPELTGNTYLTERLVSSADRTRIFDQHTIIFQLSSTTAVQVADSGIYVQQDCSITNIGGCFYNALCGVFCPSKGAMNVYYNFIATIQTKPPVGYFMVVKNNLLNISSTSTPAFGLTIPAHLKTIIFNPFDAGIAGILWFFFAIHLYKRLKIITV